MKLFISTILISSCSLFNAQIEILNEDFQHGIPSTWIVSTQDTSTVNSQVSNYTEAFVAVQDPNNELDTIASATSFFTVPASANRWLISPALTLSSFGNFISWQAKSFDASFPEFYKVLISTTDSQISSFTDTLIVIQEENYLWTTHEFNLSEKLYDNQTIYVAFVLTSNDAFKLGIDDVIVRTEDPVSVDEISNLDVSVFPNPFEDKLQIVIEEEISAYKIFSITGELIRNEKTNSNIIETRSLSKGTYLIEFQTSKGVKITQKIVKI
jgi:hypothetical protein